MRSRTLTARVSSTLTSMLTRALRIARCRRPAALLAAFVSVLPVVGACATRGGEDAALGAPDAGSDAGELAESCADGGLCPDPEGPATDAQCAELVAACCGETCGESPACAAAALLQTYEPARCADALADTQTYPRCGLGTCDTLVNKVCGADGACPDAPGCAAATTLRARATDPEASQQDVEGATSACLQALEDEIVFAPCG